jgi:TolB protein
MAALVLLVAVIAAASSRATFPGKNGRIVFVANTKGKPQIFTINPNGTGLKQITRIVVRAGHDGPAAPAWSPNGSRIAFSSDARKRAHSGADVFTMARDGSRMKRVPLHIGQLTAEPTYAPSGRRIAFTWTRNVQGWHAGGIDIANLNGRNVRRVSI